MVKYNRKFMVLGTIIIAIVVVAVIGLTYAFFVAGVEGNPEAEPTVIETANLTLVFNDTQEIYMNNILPGASAKKTFTVTNISSVKLKYDINLINVYNTFINDELVFSLTSTNEGAEVTDKAFSNVDQTLVSGVEINPGTIHEYTMVVKFKETGAGQNHNQGAEFSGKLQINTGKVYSEEVTFEMESTVGQMHKGENLMVGLTGLYYGDVSCDSSDINVAECTSEQDKITIEGKNRGLADITVREDTKNIELMYSVRVLETSLELSETIGEVILTKTKMIDILGQDYGTLSCETSNSSVATCLITGNILNITGAGVGTSTVKVKEDSKNLEVDYTVTVKDITLGLSSSSGNIFKGNNVAVGITGANYGTLSCQSNNASVATCSISGTTLTVNGINSGTTTITVKEGTLNKTVNYTVEVKDVTLGLSNTSGNIFKSKSVTVGITGSNYGTLSCTTTNAAVATCSINGAILTVNGIGAGSATITVKETNLNKSVNYSSTVTIPTLYSMILADNTAVSDSSINFAGTAGDGFYYTNNTSYGEENTTIYYFRGNINNNWLSFAGFKWRIVRTTSEGGVKLVYSGNGEAPTAALINASSNFNSSTGSKYYSGYTYNTSSYTGTQTNSTVKTVIDNWYTANLTSYAGYISTTAIFCADRSSELISGSNMFYPAYNRLTTTLKPTYACPTANSSRYTASTATGNGYLTRPIALLSVDEIFYTGVTFSGPNNTSSYIMYNASTITSNWWTMTPGGIISSAASVWYVNPTGFISGNTVSTLSGVRPAIALKSCVTVTGGNGSYSSPYTISNSNC